MIIAESEAPMLQCFPAFLAGPAFTKDRNVKKNQRMAYVYALVTVACWSTSASAFKLSLPLIGVLMLLLIASTTSTAVFGVHLVLPGQEAQPINFLWPLALVLLSIPFLGQHIELVSILALCISFAGVVVIAAHPKRPADLLNLHFSHPMRVLLALGSTVVWALYWILNTRDQRDEALRLFLNFVFGSVFVLVTLLCYGPVRTLSLEGVLGGIYIGLFEMGLAFLTWLKALRTAETTAYVANLIFLVPFLALIVLHFVARETILPSTVIGLLLIMASIAIQRLWGESNSHSS
jgi:drug/metabolite transporter (DMT)-like permease